MHRRRAPDARDRRVWRLHLTPAAAPLVDEINDYRLELNTFITQGLSSKRVDTIVDGLLQMKANLASDSAEQAA